MRHYDVGGASNDVITVSDGTSYVADMLLSGTRALAGIFSLASASSGDHTITATNSGTAANSRGSIVALEVNNLAGFDRGANNFANSTTPATGATSTLAQGNCIYFAVLNYGAGLSGSTRPPTGGPGRFWDVYAKISSDDNTGSPEFAMQTQLTGTTGVSAAWGTATTSAIWGAVIGVYRSSSGAPVRSLLTMLSNQGGF
jgi:hypothetical protein